MSHDLDPTSHSFGESLLRFESPDLVLLVCVGEVTAAQTSAIYDELDRFAEGKDHIFTIIDVGRITNSPPQARRISSERGQKLPFRGTAIVGANGPVRAVASLVFRAISLLAPKGKDDPIRFFDIEAEARVWIAERRRVVERPEAR